jgi:hypothetical protein
MARAITFVGDNRDRPNFGCRATSIALDSLLQERFEVCHRISGLEVWRPVGTARMPTLPWWLAKRVRQRLEYAGHGCRLNESFVRMGVSPDLFLASPGISADRLLAERSRSEVAAELIRQLQDTEGVVVNGEGDLLFSHPPRRKLLFLLAVMEVAHRLGTPVAYVNAMASDPWSGPRSEQVVEWARPVLERCGLVVMRDHVSVDLAESLALHDKVHCLPDALFSWAGCQPVGDVVPWDRRASAFPHEGSPILPVGAPYICLTGSSSYSHNREAPPVDRFLGIVEWLSSRGHQTILVESSGADSFLQDVARRSGAHIVPWTCNVFDIAETLRRATVLIGGRYHPAVAALGGGTWLVPFAGNSHKMRSLAELADMGLPDELPAGLDTDFSATLADAVGRDPSAREERRTRAAFLAEEAQQIGPLLEEWLDSAALGH